LVRSFAYAVCLVAGLTACGGPGDFAQALPSVSALAVDAAPAGRAASAEPPAAASEVLEDAGLVDVEVFGAQAHLYVANAGTNTITVYDSQASGNAAPVRTIGGPATGITCVRQTAVDARGYLYVANFTASAQPNGACGYNGGGEILVFAPGADGNVAPVRTIGGPATTIDNATAVAVARDGTLYVGETHLNGREADSTLLRFAPDATGNVAPTASKLVPGEVLDGITLDPYLGVITSAQPGLPSAQAAAVGYYKRDLSAGGDAIAYDDPGPLASDPATHTFVGIGTFWGPRLDRYLDGSTGNYAGPGTGQHPHLTPGLAAHRSIGGCPKAVAIGASRTLYVAGTCPGAVSAFAAAAPPASAADAPLRTISGPATLLATPAYVAVGP
jgi:hypothetical protein